MGCRAIHSTRTPEFYTQLNSATNRPSTPRSRRSTLPANLRVVRRQQGSASPLHSMAMSSSVMWQFERSNTCCMSTQYDRGGEGTEQSRWTTVANHHYRLFYYSSMYTYTCIPDIYIYIYSFYLSCYRRLPQGKWTHTSVGTISNFFKRMVTRQNHLHSTTRDTPSKIRKSRTRKKLKTETKGTKTGTKKEKRKGKKRKRREEKNKTKQNNLFA